MILRIPDYFEDFHCIADKCPDNCCVGGELEIDEATFAYYESVPGSFGQRLRESIAEAEDAEDGRTSRTFCLQVDGRCPFLLANGLCEISQKLGAAALPEVCTEYPRRTFVFGPYMTRSLTLSCPEVARMLLTSIPPVHFPEVDMEEKMLTNAAASPLSASYWDRIAEREPTVGIYFQKAIEASAHSKDMPAIEVANVEEDFQNREFPEEEKIIPASLLAEFRDAMIYLLEMRSLSFNSRLSRFLKLAESFQFNLNKNNPSSPVAERYRCKKHSPCNLDDQFIFLDPKDMTEPRKYILRNKISLWAELLGDLDVADARWQDEMQKLREAADNSLKLRIFDNIRAEHLMTYYIDRYFPLAWYDGDVLGKAKFCLFSLLMQLAMLSVRAKEKSASAKARRKRLSKKLVKKVKTREFPLNVQVWFEAATRQAVPSVRNWALKTHPNIPSAQDWIEVASLYSKAVENSEDNTDMLLEEMSVSEKMDNFYFSSLLKSLQ